MSGPQAVQAGARVPNAPFPPSFRWGVATASYQIEGAASEDGRKPSVWDVFCSKPGAIRDKQSGIVACDHYHRFKEDVALMRRLGVSSYRFSVSWTRVLPDGLGKPNQAGLDFYKRLLDELATNGIAPLCTIFHWDFPQALYERGGFCNRDSADWFAQYADLLARTYGDRIKHWATQNEPQCFIGLGLQVGMHAPGDKLPMADVLKAAHNSMRAHGKAVAALRASSRDARVGYVISTDVAQPASDSAEDLEAARASMFAVTERELFNNTWWLDPVLTGKYPEDGLALFGADAPSVPSKDLDEIRQPIDFVGLNIYAASRVRRGADGRPEEVPRGVGHPHSAVPWQPITPGCLYWGARLIHERYRLPVAITENGISTRDQVFLDGRVHDPQRIDCLHRYLLGLSRAVAEGVPVEGYWAWSLMDNFEWQEGYTERFGLVYVDYPTQRRIPKDSFEWYREVVATQGRSLLGATNVPVDRVTG